MAWGADLAAAPPHLAARPPGPERARDHREPNGSALHRGCGAPEETSPRAGPVRRAAEGPVLVSRAHGSHERVRSRRGRSHPKRNARVDSLCGHSDPTRACRRARASLARVREPLRVRGRGNPESGASRRSDWRWSTVSPTRWASSKDPGNLKLLCKTHNQWEAIQAFGFSKMERYLDPPELE